MAQGKDKASAFAICTAAFQKAGKPIWEKRRVVATNKIEERIVDKPLRIRGTAIKAGQSRNSNIYLPSELHKVASKLIGAPVYIEHVYASNAVGKVTNAFWDEKSQSVIYEAEIYDDEVQEKIKKGLIQHVSLAADYEKLEVVNGKIPYGLHNCELSLVAVPGIPESNIQIVERLAEKLAEQGELQEFIYVELHDPKGFLPEHFSVGWIDSVNGIQAIFGRKRERPEQTQPMALLFMKAKGWNLETVQKWFEEHPQYKITSPLTVGVKKPEISTENEEDLLIQERVWTRQYINNLPDSAFALILPGGEKDDEGKTVPRSLRKFPHHRQDGSIDIPHLKNANARVGMMLQNPKLRGNLTVDQLRKAKAHLDKHKKELGIGEPAESLLEKSDVQTPEWFLPYLDAIEEEFEKIHQIIDKISNQIKSLKLQPKNGEVEIEEGSFVLRSKLAEMKAKLKDAERKTRDFEAKFFAFKRMVESVIPERKVWDKWGHGPKQMIYQLKRVLRSPTFQN